MTVVKDARFIEVNYSFGSMDLVPLVLSFFINASD